MIKVSKVIDDAVDIIKKGGIIVAPTDTLYGILADALNKKAVQKVYRIKGRKPVKPFIILIPDISYLKIFGIEPSEEEKKILEKKGITVVIELPDKRRFRYLHRGTGSLAFRIPDDKNLIKLIKKVKKPLIAPSANPENKPPATNIKQAIDYFKDKVDLYIDGGEIRNSKPSTIVKLDEEIKIIREGKTSIDEIKKLVKTG